MVSCSVKKPSRYTYSGPRPSAIQLKPTLRANLTIIYISSRQKYSEISCRLNVSENRGTGQQNLLDKTTCVNRICIGFSILLAILFKI